MTKVIFIILDGLGDRPSKKLKGQTPLEAASTPNLDLLAKEGICGMQSPLSLGFTPESGPAHFEIFGYSPFEKFYPGRGVIEALGTGIKLKENDIAFRVNFATLKKGKIIDRRAGRIKNVKSFEKALTMKLRGIKFILKAGTEHRAALILRGNNLSHKLSDSDPHKIGKAPRKVKALDKEAEFTAELINEYIEKAHKILSKHRVNKLRKKEKLPEANYILLRGAGKFKKVESFKKRYGLKACCIAGTGLYKGFGKFIGMDLIKVKGATGGKDTNIKSKFIAAKRSLKKYDFVWIHIKGTDLYGHDGDCIGKKEFIEKIDKALDVLMNVKALKVITGDHSTPCSMKDHSGDDIPILFHGEGVRADNICCFGERECAKGGLQRIEGRDIMPEILNLIGKKKVIE
jgi:2,3-bisphosphoglycerate-independent phosphoglycerate mutase